MVAIDITFDFHIAITHRTHNDDDQLIYHDGYVSPYRWDKVAG